MLKMLWVKCPEVGMGGAKRKSRRVFVYLVIFNMIPTSDISVSTSVVANARKLN